MQRLVAQDAVCHKVQELGIANALSFEIHHNAVFFDSVEPNLYFVVMLRRGGLETFSVKGKCIVLLYFTGIFAKEEFICHLIRGQVSYTFVVERKTVDWLHCGG